MPTRKQRRRREKLKRHEYEYVIETEEGDEVVLESPREDAKPKQREPRRPGGEQRILDARGREVKPPSWNRVFKRAAIFGPILLIFIVLTSRDQPIATALFQFVLLMAIFLPFSYLVDRFVYRMVVRRHERQKAGR